MEGKWWITTFWEIFWRIPIFIIIYSLLAIPSYVYQRPDPTFSSPYQYNSFSQERIINRIREEFLSSPKCESNSSRTEEVFASSVRKIDSIQLFLSPPGEGFILQLEKSLANSARYSIECFDDRIMFENIILLLRKTVKEQAIFWNYSDTTSIKNIRAIFSISEYLLAQVRLNSENYDATTSVSGLSDLSFKSGDILLARSSGAINTLTARSGLVKGDYSSSYIIYKNGTDVYFISAIRDYGTTVLQMEDLLHSSITNWKLLRPQFKSHQLLAPTMIHENLGEIYNTLSTTKLPYDYKWEIQSQDRFYTSEIPYLSFDQVEINPFAYENDFTKDGIYTLLHKIGVRNVNAPLPSDYEYSPQFIVVSSNQIQFNTLVQNIVYDKLTSDPSFGYDLSYPLYALPYNRINKFITMVFGLFSNDPSGIKNKKTQSYLYERSYTEAFDLLYTNVQTSIREYKTSTSSNPDIWQIYDWIR